ncbi:MAG TPA: polysaccharide deacetylase family protein, partial [Thermodesulfobacteriota bacterium]|nr:polysaccharide deacetylase family protein [Thermodesulfobacteriota bacterium]
RISRAILEKVSPGGVILLHDGGDSPRNSDRTATTVALPIILRGLKEKGLQFLTLDEMFGLSRDI